MTTKLTAILAVVALSATAFAQSPCLGTQSLYGDDISLNVLVNGNFVFGTIPTINPGDTIEYVTGTIDYANADYYFLIEVGNTMPAPLAPGICISGTPSSIIVPAGTLGLEGTFSGEQTYPGGAAGIDFSVQALAITPLAFNGFYATSDPLILSFN